MTLDRIKNEHRTTSKELGDKGFQLVDLQQNMLFNDIDPSQFCGTSIEHSINEQSGIYFILLDIGNDSFIKVYIGKANDCAKRMREHCNFPPSGMPDAVPMIAQWMLAKLVSNANSYEYKLFVKEIPMSALYSTESELIKHFKPFANTKRQSNGIGEHSLTKIKELPRVRKTIDRLKAAFALYQVELFLYNLGIDDTVEDIFGVTTIEEVYQAILNNMKPSKRENRRRKSSG